MEIIMDTTLPVKSSVEIENLSDNDLDDYVHECSADILLQIQSTTDKIADAQEKASNAAQMKTGWFGVGTKKKTSILAEGLVSTNEAMSEMNDLLQQIIHFICISVRFAQKMNESIMYMIENGFTDRDGQFHTLTEASKTTARKIISESEKYARNQLAQELKNQEHDEKICVLTSVTEETQKRLSEKELIDQKQEESIQTLFASLKQKEQIDNIQTQKLKGLKVLLRTQSIAIEKQQEMLHQISSMLTLKDKLINEQKQQLKGIKILIKDHEKSIKKHEALIESLRESIKQKDEIIKKQQSDLTMLKNTRIRTNVTFILISCIALSISALLMVKYIMYGLS